MIVDCHVTGTGNVLLQFYIFWSIKAKKKEKAQPETSVNKGVFLMDSFSVRLRGMF